MADLTYAQMGALGSMPIRRVNRGGVYYLPPVSPSVSMLKTLKAFGLIELRGEDWHRTALGESVWATR